MRDPPREPVEVIRPAAGRRFRTWFAQLLVEHLAGGTEAATETATRRPRRRTPREKG
jgi:hypothetical protein